jgi:hypothetical protein
MEVRQRSQQRAHDALRREPLREASPAGGPRLYEGAPRARLQHEVGRIGGFQHALKADDAGVRARSAQHVLLALQRRRPHRVARRARVALEHDAAPGAAVTAPVHKRVPVQR